MRTRVSLRGLPVAFFAISLLIALPATGEAAASDDGERGWVLRVSPMWMDSDDDGLVAGHSRGSVSGFHPRDLGISVSGEYRLSPRVGLDVGVLGGSTGVGVRTRDGVAVASGTSSYGALTLGPNIHLITDGPAELFFGPFLAHVARTDVGYSHDEWAGVRVGGRFGWGAVLGIDIPVGERGWQACASVRYFDSDLGGSDENGDRFDLDFGPTAVGVGFGYRF